MKSQRYDILPRMQYRPAIQLWVCVWKDPEGLPQRRGMPMRVAYTYTGVGQTFDEALANCRKQYMIRSNDLRQAELDVQKLLRPKIPDHLLATSNLPWWKRLFRV